MGQGGKTRPPIRLFAAIVPDNRVMEGLSKLLGPLRRESWARRIRWMPRENIHMTVRFLGDTTEEQVQVLNEGLEDIIRHRVPFHVFLDSLIFLPHASRTRVLAASVRQTPPLDDLAMAMEDLARQCGFEPEKRRFLGHLTLGRCKNLDLRGQKTLCDFSRLCMRVNGIDLVQSTLTPRGAVYQSLTTFSFSD